MEKKTSEIKKFGLIFMPINWLICLIVTLILYFAVNESWGLGYLLGSLTSYLTFGLHMKSANDYGSKQANAYMHAFTNGGVRLLVSAAILMVAFFLNDEFNLIATFIGMIKREITDEEELEKLEDAIAFKNISNMPARVKCALLAWHTMEDILKKLEEGEK